MLWKTLHVIASLSSSNDLVLGNIPKTKHLTVVTGSTTLGCRSVRYDCKESDIYWGCTTAAGQEVKSAVKFTMNH